jgi:hypothetical protein
MSYEDDYRRGRSGMSGGNRDSEGYRNGEQQRYTEAVERRQREQAALERQAQNNFIGNASTSSNNFSNYDRGSSRNGLSNSATPSAPATFIGSAKRGAIIFAALYGAYAIFGGLALTWMELGVGVAGVAILGAITGAALYVVLKVLAVVLSVAFKVLAVVLVAGIALHFLGLVDFWTYSGALMRGIGL